MIPLVVTGWCVDDRHGEPCPQPCGACRDEGCEPPVGLEAAQAAFPDLDWADLSKVAPTRNDHRSLAVRRQAGRSWSTSSRPTLEAEPMPRTWIVQLPQGGFLVSDGTERAEKAYKAYLGPTGADPLGFADDVRKIGHEADTTRRRKVLGYCLIAVGCAFVAGAVSLTGDPVARTVFVFAFAAMAALEGSFAGMRAKQ